MSVSDFGEVTRGKPERSLLGGRVNKSGGRNSLGRITSWHRGGGHKRRHRRVDFKREKLGIPAVVAAIEYDPNRSANLALLHYKDGEKRYIIAPAGLSVGSEVMSGEAAELTVGEATFEEAHGVEGWFTPTADGPEATRPARDKMTVLTIIGLYPLIVGVGALVGAATDLAATIATLITVALVAALATYLVMPSSMTVTHATGLTRSH